MSDGDDDTTSIQLSKKTRKRLKLWKTEKEMTYDEAINHLLDKESDEE